MTTHVKIRVSKTNGQNLHSLLPHKHRKTTLGEIWTEKEGRRENEREREREREREKERKREREKERKRERESQKERMEIEKYTMVKLKQSEK